MLRNVFLKSLRDQRRAMLWWSLGLGAITFVTLLFYPAIRDLPELTNLYKQLPEALLKLFAGQFTDFTSPAGYLNTQLFVLMVPLLFIIFAITLGSGAIAGEEDRGTLEFLLSHPLARWRVVLEKFAAMALATSVLALVCWVTLVIGTRIVSMEIGLGRLAEVTLSSALLGLAFGTLALALGCATGKRTVSVGIASAVGVAAYFLNSLAPLVDALESLQKASPFYFYIGADPLTNGLNLLHVGILASLTVGLLAYGAAALERRDLRG
jgi:ABC-2 type transport system permease protein